jgi:hypothetical protein
MAALLSECIYSVVTRNKAHAETVLILKKLTLKDLMATNKWYASRLGHIRLSATQRCSSVDDKNNAYEHPNQDGLELSSQVVFSLTTAAQVVSLDTMSEQQQPLLLHRRRTSEMEAPPPSSIRSLGICSTAPHRLAPARPPWRSCAWNCRVSVMLNRPKSVQHLRLVALRPPSDVVPP